MFRKYFGGNVLPLSQNASPASEGGPAGGTLTFLETAVPFWGQTSQISSSVAPKRDCGSKGDKRTPPKTPSEAKKDANSRSVSKTA